MGKIAPPPKGNKLREKYKTPELRQQLFKKLLDHLRKGFPMKSFAPCDEDTVRLYIREYPREFQASMIQEAKREGMQWWMNAGRSGTVGKIKGFNSRSYQFIVSNMYGFSLKKEVETIISDRPLKDLSSEALHNIDEIIKKEKKDVDE